jgi:hypothetical protein
MDGWMDGWKEGKAGLRIAYSNQKPDHCVWFMTVQRKCLPKVSMTGNYEYRTFKYFNYLKTGRSDTSLLNRYYHIKN